ncbi:hypothetical protein GCM10010492_01860 [Saccharothrix mutabilis subsp. mutabilis]|uniref:Uncharacterized protein n=1 Tax=Saccharothrix mutabilis subsp. mutabilis TaxID=66855 RepID=A0ABN0SZX8_9PSEU
MNASSAPGTAINNPDSTPQTAPKRNRKVMAGDARCAPGTVVSADRARPMVRTECVRGVDRVR